MGNFSVEVIDLHKYYENGLVKALNGISFSLDSGRAVSLMGPSGCGKSTLLNLIGALDMPSSGEILIDGKTLTEYRPFDRFRARHIGFVFQFHHLIPNLTLLENTELPMYCLPLSGKARRDKAMEMLCELGLESRHAFRASKVSGGERQRAALARALVNNPQIILADEPTGSLDTGVGAKILDLLLNLCRKHNITVLLATHNPDIAAKTDFIIHMRDGKLLSIS